MKMVFDIYYFLYKNTWDKLPVKRGSGFLLDLLLLTFGKSHPEYLIRIPDGRHFKGNLWNMRYRALYWHRTHEPVETEIFRKLVRPGDVVLDVGANIGWYTTLAAKLVGNGKVFAFEPIDVIANELRQNVSLNKLDNVTVEQMALTDSSGTGDIWLVDTNWGLSSLRRPNAGPSTSYSVGLKTLDDWAREKCIESIALIKCDIEGAEMLFLKGATVTIHRFRPLMLLELNPEALHNFGFKPCDLLRLLSELRYHTYAITRSLCSEPLLEELGPINTTISQMNILAVPSDNRQSSEKCSGLVEPLKSN